MSVKSCGWFVLRCQKCVGDASGENIHGNYEGCPTRVGIRAMEHNVTRDQPEQTTKGRDLFRLGGDGGRRLQCWKLCNGVGVRIDDQYLCGLREEPLSTIERNIEYERDFSYTEIITVQHNRATTNLFHLPLPSLTSAQFTTAPKH